MTDKQKATYNFKEVTYEFFIAWFLKHSINLVVTKWIRSQIINETLRIWNAIYFVALNLLFEMLLPVLPISRNQNFQGGFKYQTTLFKNRALAPILWNLFYSLEEFAWKIRLTYIVLTSETHPVLSLKLLKVWIENSLPSFFQIFHIFTISCKYL